MSTESAIRWQAPELGGTSTSTRPIPRPAPGPSVEELAAIEKAARDEGMAQGRAEGYAQGEAEVKKLAAQLSAVLAGFAHPLDQLDDEVEAMLGALAVRIAGNLLGRACQADPDLVAELARTALAQAGAQAREAELHLSPADAALLQSHAAIPDSVRIVADNGLRRGELRVHTELMRLDGTLAARLDSALEALTIATPEPPS